MRKKQYRWIPKKNSGRIRVEILSSKNLQKQAWRNESERKGNAKVDDDDTCRCVAPALPETKSRPSETTGNMAEPPVKLTVEQQEEETPSMIKNKNNEELLLAEEERQEIMSSETEEENTKGKSKRRKIVAADEADRGVLNKVGDAFDTLVVGVVDVLNPCVMINDIGDEFVYLMETLQHAYMKCGEQCNLDEFALQYLRTGGIMSRGAYSIAGDSVAGDSISSRRLSADGTYEG